VIAPASIAAAIAAKRRSSKNLAPRSLDYDAAKPTITQTIASTYSDHPRTPTRLAC